MFDLGFALLCFGGCVGWDGMGWDGCFIPSFNGQDGGQKGLGWALKKDGLVMGSGPAGRY